MGQNGSRHGSNEKLSRSKSERHFHKKVLERERFGSFGKQSKGNSMRIFIIKKNLSLFLSLHCLSPLMYETFLFLVKKKFVIA